jgi:hypothetical protein
MRSVLAFALAALLLAAGCTIGPDHGSGDVRLTVTRDFGLTNLLRATETSLPDNETVMRFLQRRAQKVDTRYGGRFVESVDGLGSSNAGGRREDWFYYVNGIEADVGAAEYELTGGDRVWWDYRDWNTAMRVPAVVGSFPEPFIHGAEGKRFPVRVECARGAEGVCNEVADKLSRAGIIPSKTTLGVQVGDELLRFVVGVWGDIRDDDAVRQIEGGPGESGVFARIAPAPGGYRFDLLGPNGDVEQSLTRGAGIVAATRFEEQQPTWVVSGTDDEGLERATELLSESALRDRYAVATGGGAPISLPVQTDRRGTEDTTG